MNRYIKYLIYLLILTLFTNCSFDNKTGIWDGTKKEEKRVEILEEEQNGEINKTQVFSNYKFYNEEILADSITVLSKPIKNSSWKMSGFNHQNSTGNLFLPGISENFLKKKFGKNKFHLSKIISSPISINNNIILSDNSGTIFNVNESGKINWKKNIYSKMYKKVFKNLSFSIHQDKIFISDNLGFVYAVDMNTGEEIWLKNHGIPLKSRIKVLEKKIFLIDQDNTIICLDTDNGSTVWTIRTISSFIKSQNFLSLAISKTGNLFALNSSGDLIKINSNNGQILWSLNSARSLYDLDTDFFKSSDVVIADKDIILSTTESFFSFNIDNGALQWKKKISSTNTPIVDKNNIFLVTDNGFFINLNRENGKILWSTNILKHLKKKKQQTKISGYILGSGKIYATTLNGYLIVSSAINGKVEFLKKIANSIESSPIIINGSLYILTKNSTLIGLK